MSIMSYREYSRQKNVALQTIQDRMKNGSITKNAIIPPRSSSNPSSYPRIDSEIADSDFARLGDIAKKIAWESGLSSGEGKKRLNHGTRHSDEVYERLHLLKIINEELKSRKLLLEVEALEARLLDVNEIRKALKIKIHEVRTVVLDAVDKVAPDVLGKKDLIEVKTIFKNAINSAFSHLQNANL